MPHIPEAELHAYLDQALGRLRCVEIESHLAECTPCRATRDEIAALRDRTTAMLARLAPLVTVAPPIQDIGRRAAARLSRRERIRQRTAWAASVVAALGIGWAAASYVTPSSPTRALASGAEAVPAQGSTPGAPATTPAREIASGPQAATARAATTEPSALEHRPESVGHPTTRRHTAPASTHRVERSGPDEFANVSPIQRDGQPELRGLWRNLSWDRAREQAADNTPARIDGLPVTQVQVQSGDSGRKPLMVVAQQLASGEVIRTIEGPVSDVSALLSTRPGESSESAGSSSPGRSGNSLAFRHGDRMFTVTGSLPSDSLRAMMRRLNLMSRVR